MPDNNTYEGYHEPGHDPRLDWGRAALIATLDEALRERDEARQDLDRLHVEMGRPAP